jgi:hypothetical protein
MRTPQFLFIIFTRIFSICAVLICYVFFYIAPRDRPVQIPDEFKFTTQLHSLIKEASAEEKQTILYKDIEESYIRNPSVNPFVEPSCRAPINDQFTVSYPNGSVITYSDPTNLPIFPLLPSARAYYKPLYTRAYDRQKAFYAFLTFFVSEHIDSPTMTLCVNHQIGLSDLFNIITNIFRQPIDKELQSLICNFFPRELRELGSLQIQTMHNLFQYKNSLTITEYKYFLSCLVSLSNKGPRILPELLDPQCEYTAIITHMLNTRQKHANMNNISFNAYTRSYKRDYSNHLQSGAPYDKIVFVIFRAYVGLYFLSQRRRKTSLKTKFPNFVADIFFKDFFIPKYLTNPFSNHLKQMTIALTPSQRKELAYILTEGLTASCRPRQISMIQNLCTILLNRMVEEIQTFLYA